MKRRPSRKGQLLVACEFSAIVRDAFRKRGVDAWSCDLLPCQGDPRFHIQGDVERILDDGWLGIIAHPPCTYLTNSAAWLYKDEQTKQLKPGTLYGAARRQAQKEALDFVTEIWIADCENVVIENPQGCINTRLPFMPRPQVIQPYQFGHDASKSTCLWKRGRLPDLVLNPAQYVEPRWVCCGMVLDVARLGMHGCPSCCGERKPLPRWANQGDGGQSRLGPSEDRWAIRSETYPGIAGAMAKQWSRYFKRKQ